MARGQQKIQSQMKNAEKQAKLKKAAGNSKADNMKVTSFLCLWKPDELKLDRHLKQNICIHNVCTFHETW